MTIMKLRRRKVSPGGRLQVSAASDCRYRKQESALGINQLLSFCAASRRAPLTCTCAPLSRAGGRIRFHQMRCERVSLVSVRLHYAGRRLEFPASAS